MSASWVARITNMRHWCLALVRCFNDYRVYLVKILICNFSKKLELACC
jgi:hypothetical protein